MIGTKLSKPIDNDAYFNCVLWCDKNNATIVDRGEYYECVLKDEPSEIEIATERIKELKKWLFDSDYQAIKFAEGILPEKEYAAMRNQRIAWRQEINELENFLNK